MKLLSYFHHGRPAWGALDASGQGIVDLGRRLPSYASLMALLEADAVPEAQAALQGAQADHALSDVQLALPIPAPRKIFCIGVNYADRNAEYKDGSSLPKYPSIFMRVPGSFAAHGAPLVQPRESQQLDYEGEIGIVIGRGGRRISKETALEHIAGLTCINEGTMRDWVHHAKFNVTQGKNWQSSGAIGPWIATADEYPEGYAALRVLTRVNGEARQDDTTERLMFDFAYLISYLSTFTELEAGDVIATGTPTGAGIRFDPPRFLQPGDVVEIEVSGVGILRNVVEAES
ncbi:2-hydroxyhepta-2,4-diene-1,7-dioate isomerase [Xylophilus rhododendri]|uniref:2-hydroxyhepta-2,4-diene-1,7-dioate isomerase n=1 Tax=Xylophilus rhododendri TaxID=2697032 RepID=A0A857J3R6_9BURK|nr:fumarylacetoacetate hydrolase family protein [Xylophilus rhododendri]QHI98574.1 2-hydroxyhepta-2,4-diene-1,7-dioate isomerase [Xylophilus rhododendri]